VSLLLPLELGDQLIHNVHLKGVSWRVTKHGLRGGRHLNIECSKELDHLSVAEGLAT
jgi:hypothetical protein